MHRAAERRVRSTVSGSFSSPTQQVQRFTSGGRLRTRLQSVRGEHPGSTLLRNASAISFEGSVKKPALRGAAWLRSSPREELTRNSAIILLRVRPHFTP